MVTFGRKRLCRNAVAWKPGAEKILMGFIEHIHDQMLKVFCFKGTDDVLSRCQLPALKAVDIGTCRGPSAGKIVEEPFFITCIGDSYFIAASD